MKNIITVLFILFSFYSKSQDIEGYVKWNGEPIEGAKLKWLESSGQTKTDKKGFFKINKSDTDKSLIIITEEYKNDTIKVKDTDKFLDIDLLEVHDIDEVHINYEKDGSYISQTSANNTYVITTEGLKNLPCCNLAESFENSVGVDVSYADAITGAKQIQMLGLAGVYSQILRENMPGVKGLSTNYGMSFIPGQWLESIQISKGSAHVINGYESITGQINVELKKPDKSDLLYLNIYENSELKSEVNLISAMKLGKKISTMILAHTSFLNKEHDGNKDGFADIPMGRQLNFINRWKYNGKLKTQLNFRILDNSTIGGQTNVFLNENNISTPYRFSVSTKEYEIFGKGGFPVKLGNNSNVGFFYSLMKHDEKSEFGYNLYSGEHNSLYANLVFRTNIISDKNEINLGASYKYDEYNEAFNKTPFLRAENVPGFFAQYTLNIVDKFTMISGIRADLHNTFGTFISPRFHLKYAFSPTLTLRASSGKGYRVANIFTENSIIFASSRQFEIQENLLPEEAWSSGVSFSYNKRINCKQKITFAVDFYRTDFINQVIADINTDVRKITFYNLNGKSFSNSFQAELIAQPLKSLDITLAYRLNDVNITMQDDLIKKPFVSKHKGVFVLSYKTNKYNWIFNVTNQFIGSSPIPNTAGNPVEYRLEDKSPAYYILHLQITKKFKFIEFYFGSENLTDFKQKNPIIASDNPFGEYFDAGMIWGPISGRVLFAGLRLYIK